MSRAQQLEHRLEKLSVRRPAHPGKALQRHSRAVAQLPDRSPRPRRRLSYSGIRSNPGSVSHAATPTMGPAILPIICLNSSRYCKAVMSRSVGLRRMIGPSAWTPRPSSVMENANVPLELFVHEKLPESLFPEESDSSARTWPALPRRKRRLNCSPVFVDDGQLARLGRVEDRLVDRHHVEVGQVAAQFEAVALHEGEVGDLGHVRGDLLAQIIRKTSAPGG